MTRTFEHFAAAIAAVLIMTATFVPVVTVPASATFAAAHAPVLA